MTPSIEERLAFLKLGDEDLERLSLLRPILASHAPELVQGFYRHLMAFPETARLLKDAPTRERLLEQQRSYLISLSTTEIDEAHLEQRREIGRVHALIGLEPAWYLGAYALYFSLLTPRVREACENDDEAQRTLVALQRRLILDSQLAIEAYIDRNERDLTRLNEELSRAHREVRRLYDERGEKLRVTEQRARAAEELADTAALVAGLAHEVGTPMGVIQGHAKLLERAVADDDKAMWRLRTIQEQIDRISRIIGTLLGMARPSRSIRASVSLREVIEQTLVFIGERLGRQHIEVHRNLSLDRPIEADPERLQQVLLNLMINAADAMEEGGQLTLGLEAQDDLAIFRISDTGGGISEEVRESLFDPFVTTKVAGRGSGLGLAVARGIAADHGGELLLTHASAPGATFELRLPLGGAEAQESARSGA